MKKFTTILYMTLLMFNTIISYCQPILFQGEKNTGLIMELPWNVPGGLPYINGYNCNYGTGAFLRINDNSTAFLANGDSSIKIFNKHSVLISEIKTGFKPDDFTYENNSFYLLNKKQIWFVDSTGKFTLYNNLPPQIYTVEHLKIVNNKLYILTPDGNSCFIPEINSDKQLSMYKGWILVDDLLVNTKKLNSKQFIVNIYNFNHLQFSKTFTVADKLSSVRVIGKSGNLIFLDAEYFVAGISYKIKREIIVLSFNDNSVVKWLGDVPLPDIYYIYIKHDLYVSDNALYYLLTMPEKAQLYRFPAECFNERNSLPALPAELFQYSYHYNEHLLESPEMLFNKNDNSLKLLKAPIYRYQIIANAEPYETHEWYCNPENIQDVDCGGAHVTTPSWVQVGYNIAVPYMWGGWSTLEEFDLGLLQEVCAGDCHTSDYGAGSSCAVGVDCSGFVSRAWNLPSKYSTSTLPNISTAYSNYDELLTGDIVNYPGSHVRLVHTVNLDGSFLMIESSASATDWRVGYATYTAANLQPNYIPRYYNDVINNPPDTILPTTSIIAPNWATSNFSVSFNDSDNENINQSFFLVSDFDGTQWRANGNSGFFNDNFNDSIHSDWTNLSGTWNIVNSSLNQSDESLTNNNLYAIVQQDSANAYLYHWKMKISGSGTNRRAGIYFFCDNPEMEQRNNSYMVYFRVDQNTCQIYKSTDDNIVLQTSDPCNVELDTWYDCKIIFDPQTGKISVFQDNVLASEWTDPSPHSSGMAISLRTGNCNAFYDDIKVYKVRTANEFITVGQDMDCRYQNMNPLAPSCMVHSIVTDQAANFSELTMQTINIDWTPPTNILWVNDGLENDIDSTGSSSELSANWVTSQDENSGILKYIYAVGTSTAQDNIVPWTEIGNDTTVTVGSLNLVSTMYYFSVKAVNNAGLASEITTSDGILADVMVYDEKMNYYPSIIVSPNPFSSDICVEYNGAFKGNIKIVIYSYTGEIIYQSYFNGNKMTISLAHVAKGVYFLKITDNENNFLKKIIKE